MLAQGIVCMRVPILSRFTSSASSEASIHPSSDERLVSLLCVDFSSACSSTVPSSTDCGALLWGSVWDEI